MHLFCDVIQPAQVHTINLRRHFCCPFCPTRPTKLFQFDAAANNKNNVHRHEPFRLSSGYAQLSPLFSTKTRHFLISMAPTTTTVGTRDNDICTWRSRERITSAGFESRSRENSKQFRLPFGEGAYLTLAPSFCSEPVNLGQKVASTTRLPNRGCEMPSR